MRTSIRERLADGAHQRDAKAYSADIGFRQNIIIAAQQFHAENAPVENEQDERGGETPCRDFPHANTDFPLICSALDWRKRRDAVPAVQAHVGIPAVFVAAVAGYINIRLRARRVRCSRAGIPSRIRRWRREIRRAATAKA